MKDMDYFYERLLDKTNIKDFYDKLPSHLQSRFKDANKTKIIWGNVLQGYRGPSHFCNNGSGDSATLDAAYGVQEIRYWWGARKDLNAQMPIIGSLAFVTGRVVQNLQGQLEWTSMYFDESDGKNVSNSEAQQIQNRNRKAISLNDKGLEAWKAGDYEAAAKYFESAYRKCSCGYKGEDTYRENKNHAEAEVLNEAGDKHYRNGDFAKAYSKYDRAYDACPSSEEDSLEKIDANRDDAKAELDAEKLNRQGDRLFDQGKYSEAKIKYQMAMEKSQINKERNKYESNRDKTNFEIEAKSCDALFYEGKYGEAETKYQLAFDRSIYNRYNDNSNKLLYGELFSKSEKENKALELKRLGDIALIAGKYSESENNFEIEAKSCDALFYEGKYGEAETKYQLAFDRSIYNSNKLLYGELFSKSEKENKALELKRFCDIALIAGKYSESENYYQNAFNKASVVINKTLYEACKYKAQGHKSWQEGWDAEYDNNPDAASTKFRAANDLFYKAHQLAPDNREYALWDEISSLKLEGNDLFNQGSELQEEGNQLKQKHKYEEASSKYREAKNKFKQGLRASHDIRFQSCIDFVEDCLRETDEALQNIEMSQLNIQEEAHVGLQHTLNFIQQID